ncbi:Tn3 family transposase [Staphylococcus nepalensis]|uniref:Tn3 family transposase n=1 Tax=Staphylococcus nepalensis TaxID=214473 RepID=UPI0032E931B2|nr:Tn3 family transposase [Staphylococcus aureus]HDH5888717.1 Tn3 family transposase [Staphylococcus aureus]
MGVKELLTPDQRKEILSLNNLSEFEFTSYYSLSDYDIEVVNRHRRDHNRLGFALQLCILRNPGCTLNSMLDIPDNLIAYVAKQIDVNPDVFSSYAKRDTTRREHLEEIRQVYGYRNLNNSDYRTISNDLLKSALENGNTMYLVRTALDLLRKGKIILPVIPTIERMVWLARIRAEKRIFATLTRNLSKGQKYELEKLIDSTTNNNKTKLAWLREIPGHSSPDSFLKVIKRLQFIKNINITADTSLLHPNRLLQLARIGARYEPHSFRRFKEDKRYALLVAHLITLSQDLTDHAIEIHDRQMMVLQAKGRKTQEEMQKQNGKSVNEKVVHYADIGSALIKAKEDGIDPYVALDQVMPWEKIVESIEEAKLLSRPMDYDYLDLIKTRYNYLRKYTPILLGSLEFRSTKSAKPLLVALDTIRELNESGKRKVPDGSPLDFVPKRWQKHVFDDEGNINRQYYEMAALTELKNYIRSGDVWVEGSRLHKDFEEYLVSKDDWDGAKVTGTNIAVDVNFEQYIQERYDVLNTKLQWISKNIDKIDSINIKKQKIHVERLQADTPEESRNFSLSLYKILPRVKLTDLLMEVAEWTGFEKSFVHASSNQSPKGEEKSVVMAALMAMGTNIGLTKMAEATPDISYRQMANVMQWRLHEDAMTRAQATLVNYQHRLSLTSYWGDGTTSSSDGMRVPVGVSSLHADSNPHYGTGKGTTIYRFTSDQFTSFYAKVINTNARDAVHVIDGLLHHESDLSIEEHYTDTAGYTDQVFGLSHLLGFRFAPRLRDISDAKLYTISSPNEFPNIKGILRGKINIKVIKENFDDVLRLAHSIREGRVSGSLMMGKLGSYARQNKIATALREIGRIEKTIFILDYITNETLRRRVHRGLNKGEAMNGLARALFFGKRGEFRERGIQDQLQRASALNIIINAISVWNTVYLGEATKEFKKNHALKEELLPHISPLGWEHINFLGEYKFNSNKIPANMLRPLNKN